MTAQNPVAPRHFTVHLAVSRSDVAMSARYDNVRAGDADEAVARSIAAAEREFDVTGWQLDLVTEVER